MSEKSATVELVKVNKSFGSVVAARNIDLTFPDGSFTTLLGPSGCGKTTILRMIAGLLDTTSGDILVKGRRINDVPIHKRNLGLVFQNYALFPHKTIFDNIAFGLKYRNVPKSEIAGKVKQALDIVRLPGVEDRYPSQLSGGQQQRIAVARAIVIEPDVLLLDEPLSALDANLREEMRVELKAIQHRIGVTTIFVTHDQDEALAMSDQVVVLNGGEIEQVGPPDVLYRRPETRFVADFLGQSNILAGEVTGVEGGLAKVTLTNGKILRVAVDHTQLNGRIEAVVRAHRVEISDDSIGSEGENVMTGTVVAVNYLGDTASYFVDVGGEKIQAINVIDKSVYREGDNVTVHIRADDCVLLDESGRRVS